ncbi:MAG: PASTA domain-containing protein [Clostridia bacterium]|nr:PASTA domain-containing protein [Clostridia bacterium]
MENNNVFNDLVGTTLDKRYKIEKCLGTGGMSVVFKATDVRDGSAVAIKMLRDEIADDKEALDRFMNESKVVSMLSHPNIVSIRAVSFNTKRKYLVMEYIEGISLRTYMDKRGKLDLEEVLSFSEQILAALEHAHSRGVVHRDIKPQNILVLKGGLVKVTDFGIAKMPEKNRGKTVTDSAIGTVYYISPEQAAGKSTDTRSDLYSFGVMMYEMATGELPFDDERPISVLMMQIHDRPLPPRQINKKIPRGLERLILTTMEKDPRRRYQNAKDIFCQIRRLKDNPHCAIPSPRQIASTTRSTRNRAKHPPSRSFFPVALGIACAVCFVGLISVFYGLDMLNFGAPGSASIKIPDVMGLEYIEGAEETLGFDSENYIVNIEYETSTTVARGMIITQSPTAGSRRKPPCKVTLTVSLGPEEVTLGDYLMMNWRSAQTLLREAGYAVTIVRQENAAIPEGYVYSTDPAPGSKIQPGSYVTVYVSAGTEQKLVIVPDYKGRPEREVKAMLDADGLLVGKVTYTRSPEPAGTVLASSLEPGANAYAYVTAIDFVVSGGSDFDVNVCPDVIGQLAQSAKTLLEYYGMKVTLRTVRDLSPVGTVLTQTPSAEQAVQNNSKEIVLAVSGGPTYSQTVDMMNFVNQTLPRAEAIIEYMLDGICEYRITVKYAQSLKPRDTILAQTPAAGKVAITSGVLEIEFTLSGGPGYTPPPEEFTVPFVEGLSLADAEMKLLAAGISIGNISYINSGAPAGIVVLQSSAPGSIISGQPGRVSIDLTVSLGTAETQP